MSRQDELLLKVVERYLYHRYYITDDPFLAKVAKKMADTEVLYMWMLTQD